MASVDISQRLEQISEALVFCEPNDLPALADLHTCFQGVRDWGAESGQAVVAAASDAAAGLVEKIILSEAPNPPEAMQVLSNTIASLQAILRDGRDPNEVSFPPALGLNSSGGAVSADGGSGALSHPSGLPVHVDRAIFADFLSRQGGTLEEFEALILDLEKAPDEGDDGKMGALRRLLHSMKGESALLGLSEVEQACHGAEDALSESPLPSLVDGLLALKDWLGRAFLSYSGEGPVPESVAKVLMRLRPAQSRATAAPAQAAPATAALESVAPPAPVEAPKLLEGDLGLIGDFVAEAREHLDAADVHLLTLEADPANEEAINAVFRAFHTIKGVAGFLALDDIKSYAHEAENLLDKVRKGELQMSGPAIDVTFDAVDILKRLIGFVSQALSSGGPLERYEELPQRTEHIKAVAAGQVVEDLDSEEPETLFQPGARLGEILVESGIATEDSVESALTAQGLADKKKIGDVLVGQILVSRSQVDEALEVQHDDPSRGPIGEILVQMGAVTSKDLGIALGVQEEQPTPKLGEILVRTGQAAAKDIAHALRDQSSQRQQASTVQVKESVKVDADRLDRLVDAIGELVIAESMVCQSPELQTSVSPKLARHLSLLDKITRELQEMGTSLRMVPVRTTFQKMARLVRDLGKKSGKLVEFVMVGEDTELDKTVVDKIGDPLVHMVRNSVDHGLESSPEERRAAGKPDQGRVELRAFHKGGNIYIEIEDDGRGLDREAILAKGIERGIIREDELLSDREIWNLIFEPGFSTAKKITDVSGRGVGMDVVKRNIESLRGQVEITSEAGKGSRFSIRLPLTLAIIDGMVVRVGVERYIIPTLSIIRSIRPESREITTVIQRGEMLSLQGALVPLFRLDRLYRIAGAVQDPTEAVVVVVEDEGRQIGIMVDELMGQQQIVIKPLGEMMRGTPGVSGGAIMPDGNVGLILDVGGLVKLANTDSSD